ncbi:heterocycloanthracin/sonorensin family bacteriocin [Polaribacter sp.]|uniref:heterocycloanthracin/sonorensin family bacteriocin n=1 Tax=Polaribacter sp. TaxID=1920175 RepID=UPI0025EADAB6|nr:heterocycloanthracin/sonorensin family bacteriocin [Polaribacter sp.]
MSYKIHVTSGIFSSAFKAKKNSTSGNFDTFSQKSDYHDIELTGEKKFNISETEVVYEIKEFNDLVNRPKIIVENTVNVETKYPTKKRVFPNPQNKEYKILTILNPVFENVSLDEKNPLYIYGFLKGECLIYRKVWKPIKTTTKKNKKELKTTINKVTKSEITTLEEKTCFNNRNKQKNCFNKGILSGNKPCFDSSYGKQHGLMTKPCFRNTLYPSKKGCYSNSIGYFSGPQITGSPMPCYSGCFGFGCFNSGCFGCFGNSCFSSGLARPCFNSPILRALFNLFGLLSLFMILAYLICNLGGSVVSIPKTEEIKETDQTNIIAPDSLMVNKEKIINPIKESEIIDMGSTDRVFLFVGDFEDEDGDTVNLYFNDEPIASNLRLQNNIKQFELTDVIPKNINTLRVEAVSNGTFGSPCTTSFYVSKNCFGEQEFFEKNEIYLFAGKEENKRIGEIYFYINELDCVYEK